MAKPGFCLRLCASYYILSQNLIKSRQDPQPYQLNLIIFYCRFPQQLLHRCHCFIASRSFALVLAYRALLPSFSHSPILMDTVDISGAVPRGSRLFRMYSSDSFIPTSEPAPMKVSPSPSDPIGVWLRCRTNRIGVDGAAPSIYRKVRRLCWESKIFLFFIAFDIEFACWSSRRAMIALSFLRKVT